MKKLKWLSILLACLMALVFISCDNNSGGDTCTDGGTAEAALNGTWVMADDEYDEHDFFALVLYNGNFQMLGGNTPVIRGTYHVVANFMVINPTHINGEIFGPDFEGIPLRPEWYTRDELLQAATNVLTDAGEPDWIIEMVTREIDYMFSHVTGTFVLGNDTLSLTFHGETDVLTRRN